MQAGILSLMQTPRTTIEVQDLRAAKKPYIVVLTNPATGSVTASYAMPGDIHIAEPSALIGFAGSGLATSMAPQCTAMRATADGIYVR
jgi:acetyl-CoA carboxylase carboxyl transferase subunit beta